MMWSWTRLSIVVLILNLYCQNRYIAKFDAIMHITLRNSIFIFYKFFLTHYIQGNNEDQFRKFPTSNPDPAKEPTLVYFSRERNLYKKRKNIFVPVNKRQEQLYENLFFVLAHKRKTFKFLKDIYLG